MFLGFANFPFTFADITLAPKTKYLSAASSSNSALKITSFSLFCAKNMVLYPVFPSIDSHSFILLILPVINNSIASNILVLP